jgi:uncharacterized protein YndB with AHSA1/START domain
MTPETRATVSRRLRVPPERIFAAFAAAEQVARWLSPSPDIALEVLAYDFRINGRYRFAYHVSPEWIMHVHGAFREIVSPTRLSFSWVIEPPDEHAGLESEVRVRIDEVPGGAILMIEHEQLDRAGAVERHTTGWIGALDRLESLLHTGA